MAFSRGDWLGAEFSNISGTQQIRFSQGHIKETFGDFVAVIGRERADPGDWR